MQYALLHIYMLHASRYALQYATYVVDKQASYLFFGRKFKRAKKKETISFVSYMSITGGSYPQVTRTPDIRLRLRAIGKSLP